MVNNSNKISTKQTTTCQLKNIEHKKKTITYGIGNSGPGLGQAQQCGRVKPINGIPTPH